MKSQGFFRYGNKVKWALPFCLFAFLLSGATGLYVHHLDRERISELESQISVLEAQEKKSEIDRRVSKQMEEIAYGQQTLAEEQSQEALRQSEIAQAATLRSEADRQNALEAQAKAENSAEEARQSYQMAERQRQEADNQRREAEHAKLVADTLNYISLGRTLGTQSYAIYQTGDTELGNMLAYASYLYTHDYGGDLFVSSVFHALTQSAVGSRNSRVHNGSISCTDVSPKDNHSLTVSTCGEIIVHRMQGDQMQSTLLMSDRRYSFRDAYSSKYGRDYAVSHTGHLVVADGKEMRVLNLEHVDCPFSLRSMNSSSQLLIIGVHSIALMDLATDEIIGTRQLDFRVISTGRCNGFPLLFDDRGGMHQVRSLDDISNEKVPVPGLVTAYASRYGSGMAAYGMSDGTIWLVDEKGLVSRLVGHLSEVTKLKFDGSKLYSSSYDGKLYFWKTDEAKIEPITLFQTDSWLTDFTFSKDMDYIWTGEQNGTVTEYLVSVPKMVQRLRKNVKRNFTQEEWDYYVGKGIPYRELVVNNVQ